MASSPGEWLAGLDAAIDTQPSTRSRRHAAESMRQSQWECAPAASTPRPTTRLHYKKGWEWATPYWLNQQQMDYADQFDSAEQLMAALAAHATASRPAGGCTGLNAGGSGPAGGGGGPAGGGGSGSRV